MERSINTLNKTIKSMDSPLKLAQTRLKKRSLRPEIENCADEVNHTLVGQVKIIMENIKVLQLKSKEAEAAHMDLKKNLDKMEADLRIKKNSLMIDQQRCMFKRKIFPYNILATQFFLEK